MNKDAQAEKAYQQGLYQLSQGRGDLAQQRFQQAEKLGMDVAGKFKNETRESISAARTKIRGSSVPGAVTDKSRNMPTSSGPKPAGGQTHGFVGGAATEGSASGGNSLEGHWEEFELCGGVKRKFWTLPL